MKGKQATLYGYLNAGLYEIFPGNATATTTSWVLDFDAYDPEGDKSVSLISATPTIDDSTKKITLQVPVADLAGLIPTGDTQRVLRWRIRLNPGSGFVSLLFGDLVLRHGGPS